MNWGWGAPTRPCAVGFALIWEAWRDDGRIRLAPRAPLYPCYTAEAARSAVPIRLRQG